MRLLDRFVIHLLAYWQHPRGRRYWVAVGLVAVLVFASALFVYATGGIKYVFAHSMYLPILLAGAVFGWLGGVVAGIAGGLALGPWMPIDTTTGEMQEPLNWIFRVGLFVLVGLIVGLLVDAVVKLLGQDPVSGAPSQLPLRNDIRERIDSHASGKGTDFSLILVVFDNHSSLVSTFGPEVGLQLVRGLVERLQKAANGLSKVYHIHGEHFALLCRSDAAGPLLRRIHESSREPLNASEIPLYVNLTIGRADYPSHGCDPDQLIQRATIAADTAKRRGESEVAYDIRYDYTNQQNLILLSSFRSALASEQVRLYYQPQIDLRNGHAVIAVEALVRWLHPVSGLLAPGAFVPQVEKTHLIHDLTRWVIEAALRDLQRFEAYGLGLRVAVNVSTRNLHDPMLLTTIDHCLKASGVAPDRFELEVTESAVLADPDKAQRVLNQVREWGVGVAIDDFGAGQTSLGYLKRLPASCLKIDRSFIGQIADNTADQRIVESVVTLAHRLDMKVVAEGIEDERTLLLVDALGCDIAQGFFIGRPGPIEQILATLEGACEERRRAAGAADLWYTDGRPAAGTE
ncbi:hypothetical protein CKO15_04515 [Halorhodospira abdelmalekii]|uniref:bifunctional diguanylate cyclase/phosphodiesterase n=1 Tax=Halorhodospira abdelmalekii TaxID=421629 RepID=UPI0019063FE6|nr:GGDEF domain-containing phosphodiesterase [Halorhodospira abdelmalekii]MBK1734559.1 hypothetical protein [Halorhodospira abdelmalekii]